MMYIYPAGQHPLYPYTPEDRAEILKALGLNENHLKNAVETITEWVQKQPHLAEAGVYSQMIEMCMIATKGSIEKVKQKFDSLYKLRLNAPELFKNRIEVLNNPDCQIWDSHVIAAMPKLYNGVRVTFAKVFDVDNLNWHKLMMNCCMVADTRFFNDFMAGEIWVMDLNKFTLSHILRANLMPMAKGYMVLHEGVGVRVVAIHIINCSVATLGQAVLNLLNIFFSKKLLSRLKFHETLEEFHKFLPKEYCPKDYGGELPTMAEFRDKLEKSMTSEKSKQFLIETCKIVSDESKRPRSEYNEDFLPGTFQKLDLD